MQAKKRFSRFRSMDLATSALPNFDWANQPEDVIIQDVFRLVEARVIASINWYLSEKKRKALWSRLLRFVAVVGVASGAATPLLAQMSNSISLVWGYLALGVAAFAVGMDRALGFSATWLRYMRTAVHLQQILKRAQLEWANCSVARGRSLPVERAWLILINLDEEASRIIRDETEEWSIDTRSQLRDMEGRAKSQAS